MPANDARIREVGHLRGRELEIVDEALVGSVVERDLPALSLGPDVCEQLEEIACFVAAASFTLRSPEKSR